MSILPKAPDKLQDALNKLRDLANGPKGGRSDYVGMISGADALTILETLEQLEKITEQPELTETTENLTVRSGKGVLIQSVRSSVEGPTEVHAQIIGEAKYGFVLVAIPIRRRNPDYVPPPPVKLL